MNYIFFQLSFDFLHILLQISNHNTWGKETRTEISWDTMVGHSIPILPMRGNAWHEPCIVNAWENYLFGKCWKTSKAKKGWALWRKISLFSASLSRSFFPQKNFDNSQWKDLFILIHYSLLDSGYKAYSQLSGGVQDGNSRYLTKKQESIESE